MASVTQQDLSIRANQFISYFIEEFSDTPLSISRPPSTENPEVKVRHGEDRSFMTFEFKASVIRTEEADYVVNEPFDEVTFSKIADDIREKML